MAILSHKTFNHTATRRHHFLTHLATIFIKTGTSEKFRRYALTGSVFEEQKSTKVNFIFLTFLVASYSNFIQGTTRYFLRTRAAVQTFTLHSFL